MRAAKATGRFLAAALTAATVAGLYLLVLTRGSWPLWSIL